MSFRQGHAAVAAVRELLARAVAAGVIPGGVAAWQVGDEPPEVVTAGCSVVRPVRRPTNADVRYDLASLTKPLATTTLMLLARRARLIDLDDNLGDILPEAEGRPAGALRFGELLSHTAGLPAWVPLYALAPQGGRQAVLETILSLPLAGRRRIVYSDVGFVLLGLVLERLLHEPLAEAFMRRVASPLGCAGAIGFAPLAAGDAVAGGAASPSVEEALSRDAGFAAEVVPAPATGMPDDGNARFLGGAAGHAGLFGTAVAVLAVARQYLPGADGLLTDDEIQAVTRASIPPGDLVRSPGWQLAGSRASSAGRSLSPESWGHTGFTGTSAWVDPSRRAVLVLLSNRHHPTHRGVDLHPLRRRFHALALGLTPPR